jgi:hypothetical protein
MVSLVTRTRSGDLNITEADSHVDQLDAAQIWRNIWEWLKRFSTFRSVRTKLLLVTSSQLVKLSERRAATAPASRGEPIVASRELPPHTSRRTIIQMKSFHATLVMLAITALGVGQSAAQTGAPSLGGMGATSPLGADFGQSSGNSPSAAQTGTLSIGATSPLGADFGQTPGNNSQITPAPFTNPAACTSGGSSATGLSTFDGGGLSPTSGGLSPTTSFTTSGVGAESTTSTPCNSVSSSGVTSAANSAATTTPSANSSSLPSSASSGLGSSTTATVNNSPNTASLGVTGLGTNGLGTTGLGTTGLGSLPTQSGSTLQTGTSPSTATQSETTCSGYVGTLPANTTTVTAGSLSGGVPDPAQSLGSSTTDAAQSLGGTASVPVTPVPCPTTSTTATIP